MAENITYPPYDAMLAGTSVLNTWSDGTQFSIGNTTYAWDPTPGLWRAFTTATSSSSGGDAGGGFGRRDEFYDAVRAGTGMLFLNQQTGGVVTQTGDVAGRIDFSGGTVTLTGGTNGSYGHVTAQATSQFGRTYDMTATGGAYLIAGRFAQSSYVNAASISGEVYIPAGDTITFVQDTFNATRVTGTLVDLAAAAGGSSTTVNIGGGGAGLQLGVTAKDTITTSTTITADDLSGTGPAWVLLGGGGGSGAVAQYNRVNNPSGSAGAGGAGGNYGFFINDSASLVGATFTAGASGTAQSNVGVNVGDGTTVIFGSDGTAGTTSTLVLDGTTYTCTGGGGGVRGNPGTAGAAGTATATGGTPLDLIDVQTINTDIDTYWDGFIVVDATGDLRLGGNVPDAALTGSGGGAGDAAFAVPQGRDGEGPVRAVNSGSGSAGSLQIVYQNQA